MWEFIISMCHNTTTRSANFHYLHLLPLFLTLRLFLPALPPVSLHHFHTADAMRTNILLFISACGLLLPVSALPYADLTSDEAAVGTTRKFQGINPPTVSTLTTTQALTPLYERDTARETWTDKETAIPTSTPLPFLSF